MGERDYQEYIRSIAFIEKDGSEVKPDLEPDDSDDPEGDNPEDSQCLSCRWYKGAFTCKAYPGQIPLSIFDNTTNHNKIYPTQVGTYIWRKKR